MENKYVWDLDDILESKTLDDLYLSWKEQMEKLIKIYNDIFISEENFINWIEENDKFDQLLLLIESGIKSIKQMNEIKRINQELSDTYEKLEKA